MMQQRGRRPILTCGSALAPAVAVLRFGNMA